MPFVVVSIHVLIVIGNFAAIYGYGAHGKVFELSGARTASVGPAPDTSDNDDDESGARCETVEAAAQPGAALMFVTGASGQSSNEMDNSDAEHDPEEHSEALGDVDGGHTLKCSI